MISLDNLAIFKNNLVPLAVLAKTAQGQGLTALTDANLKAVDFDAVKTTYARDLKLSQFPKSNDALVFAKDGNKTFIEFKSGKVDNYAVRKKNYDSILIYTDITKQTIKDTRSQMDYILVYNNEVYSPDQSNSPGSVQDSKSRDSIARGMLKLADKRFIKFGLDIFENYCFKRVFTYTQEEFMENFVQVFED